MKKTRTVIQKHGQSSKSITGCEPGTSSIVGGNLTTRPPRRAKRENSNIMVLGYFEI